MHTPNPPTPLELAPRPAPAPPVAPVVPGQAALAALLRASAGMAALSPGSVTTRKQRELYVGNLQPGSVTAVQLCAPELGAAPNSKSKSSRISGCVRGVESEGLAATVAASEPTARDARLLPPRRRARARLSSARLFYSTVL